MPLMAVMADVAVGFLGAMLAVALGLGAWLWRRHRGLRAEHRTLLREREVIYHFVHDVGEVFAETDMVEVDPLLEKVLFYAMRTTQAGAGVVYLLDPDGVHLRARAISGVFPPFAGAEEVAGVETAVSKSAFVADIVRGRLLRKGEGIFGEVADFGTPVLIEDAERDPRVPQHTQDFLRIRSLLAVPMRFRHRNLGVMAVVNRTDGSPFIQADQGLLQALADQASVSTHYALLREDLDAKKRLDHDLAIARRIQQLLLPADIPQVPGLDLAAFNVPALMVGGDYYDVVRADEEHVGFVVADVSGKSIGGALVMSVCRSALRAHAAGRTDPAEVLCDVSREVARDLAEDMFVTMLYVIVNHRTREAHFARAGHERLVLCRGGRARELDGAGTAIGMGEPAAFDELLASVPLGLEAGDLLLAYTDGITEAMSPEGEEWGAARLMAELEAEPDASARETIARVRERLNRFTGGAPPADDMTMVAVRVNPVPPR